MKVILTEKPSVARAIAKVIGATTNEAGYIAGNGYAVTWALGHLVTLAMPEAYGATGFNRERLPILPERFKLEVRKTKTDKGYTNDQAAAKQLKVIGQLFKRCESIIVATDAGREGELIFRYIYDYLGCRKPFERLWISSLTESAITKGLNNLKAGELYDNLYLSAKARSEADWLIGINTTQALTITASEGTYSLGRVQTPTLMMIYNRYLESQNFTKIPYWQVKTSLAKDGISLDFTSAQNYDSEAEAQAAAWELSDSRLLTIESINRKEIVEEPPLLHDLTSLQKEMNKRHGFSADKTLSTAQWLYEAKYITYPRSGSCYIPDDVADEICDIFKEQEQSEVLADMIEKLSNSSSYPRCVDESKVTDHHAIIVTWRHVEEVSNDARLVYEQILYRMVEAFSNSCIKERVTVEAECKGRRYRSSATAIKRAGWRSVLADIHEEEDPSLATPTLYAGDVFKVAGGDVVEKQTQPRPLLTEATLLASMETAGNDIENEEERQAIKDSGIGTPATRASIIETLFNRNYIRREGKKLVPTDKGIAVCEVIKHTKIANAHITGMWESALAHIERGEMSADTFGEGVRVLATQMTRELLNSNIQHSGRTAILCPKCKKQNIVFFDKVAKCGDPNCGLVVFRYKGEKQLTERDLTDLLTVGKTALIKGFVSKSGKGFNAMLRLDENYNVQYYFPDKR